MPTRYRYLVDQVADETVENASERDQRVMRDFFRFLATHPFTEGDQQIVDASGRTNQVKSHDRFVITYSVDHAVCEVRSTAVEFF